VTLSVVTVIAVALMSQPTIALAHGDPDRIVPSQAAIPQAPPASVRIYVYTDAKGEGAELASRRESVKDLRAALAEKKGLIQADTEGAALVVIEVAERTTTIPKFAFGSPLPPGQRTGVPAAATPVVREVHLHVKLTWRDAVFAFTNKSSPAETGAGWRLAASDVAKQLDKWITDHRAEILKVQ